MKREPSEIERALLEACKLAVEEIDESSPAHQALCDAIAKAEYDPFNDPDHDIMQRL